MKKFVGIVLAAVMTIASVTGCGSAAAKDAGETLKVGIEIGYPPMEYFDEDGATAIGFDVEFAKALGEDFVKVYLKIKRDEWRDFIANVSQWEIDNYLTRL